MKTLIRLVLSLLASSYAAAVLAQADVDLENEDNRIAYALGVNIGQNIASQQLLDGISLDVFIAGITDSIAGDVRLDDTELMAAIQTFMQRQQEATATVLSDSLAESEAFLAENAGNEGVVTLDSGLQYLILESGPADGASPSVDDSVLAHYHGTLSDGTVFDSSVDRGEPATFGLSQVIAGWTEALQLMKTGDKWRLFIPPDLAYGEASPTPAIPPNSALIFDVELMEIH